MIVLTSFQEKDKLFTVSRRIDAGKVEIEDKFGKKQPITASESYRVGDRVLVVSGVIVGAIGKQKIKTYTV